LFRSRTTLRLVKAQVGLSGVEHMESLLSGAYIEVRPGTGRPHTDFMVPPLTDDATLPATGLNIVLETPTLGSLQKGSPIYYRQIRVGRIVDYRLSPTAQEVWLTANIEPAYSKLIYAGTKFWNASGIKVSGSVVSGMTMRTESMQSLLAGGVALATPEGDQMGTPVFSGKHFPLAETVDEEWLKWQPQLPPTAGKEGKKTTNKASKGS
jgi:paraquat-inducible protein B